MVYDWEKWFCEKLHELAQEETTLDIGGGHPFQKRMTKYKYLFDGKKFETLDHSPIYNPTYIGDAEDLPFDDECRTSILCLSVLEHLKHPQRAVEEMYRVLKPRGKVLCYTHFIYPYHARSGVYGDFYRFTHEQISYLFRDFSKVEIKKHGGYFHAMGFFMPFQARMRPIWEPITYVLDKLLKTEDRNTTAGYYVYAIK